jgi:hypothetical protein
VQEQPIEVVGMRGRSGDPAVADPSPGGGLPGLGVRPGVVLADDELLDRAVEVGQGERRW